MKTSILILLFALLAVAVNAGKFKQRHGELKGLQSIFYRLDRRLTNQISRAKRQINSARVRRNRHHAARRRAHSQLKIARSRRLAAEVRYNSARKTEEQKLRVFKAAHKVYLNSRRNYNRVYKSKTQAIREWDHERSVIEKVRKLLGVNHSKKWKNYKKDGGVRYQGKTHGKYTHIGTHFHQGRKRFLRKNKKYVRAGCLKIFQHYNLGGRSAVLCGSKSYSQFFNKRVNGFRWNDQVSSVCVGKGNDYKLFQHNFNGRSFVVKAGTCRNVPRYFNDQLSSVKKVAKKNKVTQKNKKSVRAGCLKVFQHYNYGGRSAVICGTKSYSQFFNKRVNGFRWNDQVSSVCVGKGNDYKLFQHNFNGKNFVVKAGTCRNVPRYFNDQLSSVKKLEVATKAVIKGTGDDRIRLFVNGKSLGNKKNQNSWNVVDTWNTQLKKGDVLLAEVINVGKAHGGNPGGLLLQVNYKGKTLVTSTANWYCTKHTTAARSAKKSAVKRLRKATLQTFKYPKINGMSSSAKWIWAKNLNTPKVACYFVVPN